MKRKIIITLFTALFLTGTSCVLLYAQESETEDASIGTETESTPPTTGSRLAPAATESQQTPIVAEPEVQWLWGEVVSVDTNAKQMTVKYLDYETDTEKEMNIKADDKTTYENVKSLDEIKVQDTLSIDYIVADGKNIAKNISVETNGSTSSEPKENKEEPKPTPGLE